MICTEHQMSVKGFFFVVSYKRFSSFFFNWNNNQNFGWRLVFNIWFLVHGLSNEKNTSWVFLWNFIPMRIVCLSLDTERRQFKEKFPTHDSTMKQILVFETPFKVLVYFLWYTNFLILQGFIIFHLSSYIKIVLLYLKI